MDNRLIERSLLEMARGLEYLDENPFRVQAYRKAADAVAGLDMPLEQLLEGEGLSQIPGIGSGLAARIRAWVKDHDFSDLEDVRSRLPEGLDELLKVPGLGIRRIRALHRERSISTLEDLSEALNRGGLKGLRSFSKKFIDSLPPEIERVMGYRGRCTIDIGLSHAQDLRSRLLSHGLRAEVSGLCRRMGEVIDCIELIVEGDVDDKDRILSALDEPGMEIRGAVLTRPSSASRPKVRIKIVPPGSWTVQLLLTTGAREHVAALQDRASCRGIVIREDGVFTQEGPVPLSDEEDIYSLLGLQFLPPEVREGREIEMALAESHAMPELIRTEDIRGTIHNHTTYSDGRSTLEEMVRAAADRGYQWIGISDHSRSASYAGGLDIDAVTRQHREIDELGRAYPGITIFKGIESDILSDGSLDYPPEVLEGFDFVVASIHTGMEMDRRSMTRRIIRAVRNPFTTMLAHPTGRLILAREPYEVDMDAVLAEALSHSVIMELNANPLRLDIDWRLIRSFTSSGGIIALCPDAHTVEGLDDMAYGVGMARKGFLTADACLNAKEIDDVRRLMRRS